MRNRQSGHAIIELALSAGVMVAFLGGTFEFGYTFYVYNQLVSAVGNGGRYAAQQRSYHATLTISRRARPPFEIWWCTGRVRRRTPFRWWWKSHAGTGEGRMGSHRN